ncbi:N-terminal [Hibiscus syriacus]|uniref:N-terminal n=1 Tax=Hibiscus syriacus TaxID=106335 RepID=A0A6A3CZ77_HIBSY|nr:N-terminal [Hibiscus syriacus]
MATLNPVNNPSGIGNFGGDRVPRNRLLPPSSPRFIRGSSNPEAQAFDKTKESISHGADEKVADNVKDNATSTANQVKENATGMTGKVTGTAQGTLSAKAKQVWETAIETAQKAKETVLGKADDSKDGIKEIKQSMDNN